MSRQNRHACCALGLGLICAVFIGLAPFEQSIQRSLSLALGYSSLVLLAISLGLGPLAAIRGRRIAISTMLRRDVGIWTGVAGCLHVVFALQTHVDGQLARYFFRDLAGSGPDLSLFGIANRLGALATVMLLVLLALSNNHSLRRLGSARWKRMQRLVYPLAGLVIVHAVAYQVIEARGVGPALGLAGLVTGLLGLRLFGRRKFSGVQLSRRAGQVMLLGRRLVRA